MLLYIICTAIYIFHPVGGRLAGCAACPLTLAAPRTPLPAGWAHWQILAGVPELSRVPELADPLAPHQASGSARPRLPAGGTMGTEGGGRPQPGQAAGGGFGSRPHPAPRPAASLSPATVPLSHGDGLGMVTSRRWEPPPCPAGAAGCQTPLSLQLDCGLRTR